MLSQPTRVSTEHSLDQLLETLGVIGPWNFPLQLSLVPAAAALGRLQRKATDWMLTPPWGK